MTHGELPIESQPQRNWNIITAKVLGAFGLVAFGMSIGAIVGHGTWPAQETGPKVSVDINGSTEHFRITNTRSGTTSVGPNKVNLSNTSVTDLLLEGDFDCAKFPEDKQDAVHFTHITGPKDVLDQASIPLFTDTLGQFCRNGIPGDSSGWSVALAYFHSGIADFAY